METRETLPVHGVPEDARRKASAARLRIEGLVSNLRFVDAADLASLLRVDLNEDFSCEEGWTVPDQRWSGVRLSDVLGLASPLAEARYVRVGAGEFVVPLAIDAARAALLCDRMNDAPIALEHGAPWRLFVPGSSCYTSVKWVDRLELAAEPGENTGERIARGRLPKTP